MSQRLRADKEELGLVEDLPADVSVDRRSQFRPVDDISIFTQISPEDAYELMKLPAPVRYYAMDLTNRGVKASSASFYMESARDPHAVYKGMVEHFEQTPGANFDVVAELYFRRLPEDQIAATILLDERVNDVDLVLMQIAREKAFRKFDSDLIDNLADSRSLLNMLHLPGVFDAFQGLNQSQRAYNRRHLGDARQFDIDTIEEQSGDRFGSASTLYLQYKVPAQTVLDVLSLKKRTDYTDFFIIASVLHNAGLGEQIQGYADLFLQAAKDNKSPTQHIDTVN